MASVCLGAVALTSVPVVSMAATAVEPIANLSIATPYMTYIVGAGCQLSISGSTATVNVSVDGDSTDATKAEVIAEKKTEMHGRPLQLGVIQGMEIMLLFIRQRLSQRVIPIGSKQR